VYGSRVNCLTVAPTFNELPDHEVQYCVLEKIFNYESKLVHRMQLVSTDTLKKFNDALKMKHGKIFTL
jgi:hypothetical protein